MSGDFKTGQAPSTSIGASSNITQHKTIEKQVVGVSFSEKLAQFGGALAAQLGNGVATVSSAIGFAAGRSAGVGLSGIGQQLAAFGTTNPANISTQVHGMSNSMGANGAPAVATGPGSQGQPSFGAGTSGPGTMQSKQAAFGVGAVGLDSAGLAAGGGGMSGGGMSVGGMGGATGGSMGGAIGTAAGGGGQDQLLNATKQMQETQMSFNLQYLQLQSQMQHENRSYTAISNIMKTKHDTVKNSISNVR